MVDSKGNASAAAPGKLEIELKEGQVLRMHDELSPAFQKQETVLTRLNRNVPDTIGFYEIVGFAYKPTKFKKEKFPIARDVKWQGLIVLPTTYTELNYMDYVQMRFGNGNTEILQHVKAEERIDFEVKEVGSLVQNTAITKDNYIELFARGERMEEVATFIKDQGVSPTLFNKVVAVHEEKVIPFREKLQDLNLLREYSTVMRGNPWSYFTHLMPVEWKALVHTTMNETPIVSPEPGRLAETIATRTGGDENHS